MDVAMVPTYFSHYLNIRTLCTRALKGPHLFPPIFLNLFKEKHQLNLLVQLACMHQFPMWKSAHLWTWETPCILSSHWTQYTCYFHKVIISGKGQSLHCFLCTQHSKWQRSDGIIREALMGAQASMLCPLNDTRE